ncbi:hypothetical protein I309_04250 [Cryptococcus deuterogattii LA55]|nr:hypothetical protein I309_04250 [Cryptococcus deuterogattii LA55]KIR74127.1 hypothetical protein I310_01724 [Cryptococcus deuterogattii CA1014]KIR94386.1 hypothetical protein I304_02028 [Cryptococcus deuterogattii CBS 10090]KIR96829.1 hypothetical protein L804_05927 [Cryptococcus deuterogattii 2001/935-1]
MAAVICPLFSVFLLLPLSLTPNIVMPFLRKSSISKKEGLNSNGSPRIPSSKSDTPSRMRNVSDSSAVDDGTSSTGKHKRKHTLLGSKGRKKLSSLFSSSSSLSSYIEREGTASPKQGRSKLNVSSTSSGTSTPSRSTQPGGIADAQAALNKLSIGAAGDQVTESPESSPTVTPNEAAKRQRRESLWSQWELEGAGESSDEDDAFLTPSEGLSEVEEADEEEDELSTALKGKSQPSDEAAIAHVTSATPGPLSSPTDVKVEPTNVVKGSIASDGDIAGTGISTIHRTFPSTAETKVKRHMSHNRPEATTVDQAAVLADDIETCREAIRMFLTSRMKEAEEFCEESESEGHHLYLQSAMGIIEALKGMMTFDSVDLHNALDICKSTAVTASSLRRPSDNVFSRLGGMVKSHGGLARVKAMTPLERHAELVYAEQSLMKAMLAIISGGDWIGLGVLLGTGTSSLMLSLLPGKVLKIAEVFGYAGDRKVALATLMAAGGWSHDSPEPAFDETNEGLRRPVCDLILLAFHLVISVLIPITGVDVPLAKNILAYNMRRYPNARLHTTQCQPAEANDSLQRALDLKLEYIQLQHMCLWDYACNHMMLGNWKGALDCFSILKDESNWSRAVYTYAAAACIVELIEDGDQHAKISEAERLMQQIPKLTKKIAGKSLPIEDGEENYGNGTGKEFWDDYVLAHFLRGMCQFIARYQPLDADPSTRVVLPTDPSNHDLDQAAEKDFKAVIRHTPDVQLDHWILFHCYYELGRLYARRGDDEQAKHNFEVVMSGKLPDHNAYMAKAAGKYSLEGALLLKTHAALSAVKEREKERSGKR